MGNIIMNAQRQRENQMSTLNLSGEHEHLPTDGTFAPYSVQQITSI